MIPCDRCRRSGLGGWIGRRTAALPAAEAGLTKQPGFVLEVEAKFGGDLAGEREIELPEEVSVIAAQPISRREG